jgi:glycosyltransferase involved in cell wall biosynthesis
MFLSASVPAPRKLARPLRVCHVVATSDGARWVYEQLRELRDRHGMDVTAILPGDRGTLVDLLRADGIRFLSCDFSIAGRHPKELGRPILEMARLLRRERFDVVQTHVFPSMMITRIAAWLADVPLRVAMVAGPFHLQADASCAIDCATCFMDDVLIASCELTRTLYRERGVSDDRIALVYYGQDPARFDPAGVVPAAIREENGWPADSPVVGMVAYFYPRLGAMPWIPRDLWNRGIKGHEDLVEAAVLVLRERPETKFLIVGGAWGDDGEKYQRDVMELARSRGLDGCMVFTGHRKDVPQILRAIDVSVQASLNENLGGTLESLFMERPLVATRVGGMVDSVRDGETGVLVEPDSPADLARGILELLRDPRRAQALGRAGRRLMLERFTLGRTADELAQLYTSRVRTSAYRPIRTAARAVQAVPIGAYLGARLRYPEHPLLRTWDRRLGRA